MQFKYLSEADLIKVWDGDLGALLSKIEQGYLDWKAEKLILPEKASMILDERNQSRVNCMPCAIPRCGYVGVKLVSVFPDNPNNGLPNVMGQILLFDVHDGTPVALMDAGYITSLRTAAVGGLAAKYLANSSPKKIGIIGSGEEAYMHLKVMSSLFPSLSECAVASRKEASEKRFKARALANVPNVKVETCSGNYEKATCGADIIITAISAQEPVLKASMIKEGCFYCHVGGWEDEYKVAKRADKIICDSWSDLKHRGSPTIARMYQEGMLNDSDIYANLVDIIDGTKPGRESSDEFIYFNSIGMALTDVIVAGHILNLSLDHNVGIELSR